MRKAVAVLGMTGALAFGGAGISHATTYEIPAPAATTTVAQTDHEDGGDNTGLWGLAGLLGLLGLLGLKRRDNRAVAGTAGSTAMGVAPPRHAPE
jgi:LPXTG-motif cell wall-anchored protein